MPLHLSHDFATALPELSVPWSAEEVADPQPVVVNAPLAQRLGLDPEWLGGPEGARFLSGQELPDGATPVAQGYAGHQFGGYSPRLGDGRALLLGEVRGEDGRLLDVHLKGSGPTPFSRGGDGRAALGPMLREHLVSEAMHALGMPTTRSLGVVATGRSVMRADGPLPGAVLARVASSHLRVGSFQYAAALQAQDQDQDEDLVRRLADYAITRHHPQAADADQPYLALLQHVVRAQGELVAQWMCVGFVHGVMNTDNMTISGETIDYGPCAFLDAYDPAAVFSSIDTGGRYAYRNQPAIAHWNLARFAETLIPLLDPDQDRAVEIATEALNGFARAFSVAWVDGMRRKLGLSSDQDDSTVGPLADQLLQLLTQDRVDHTGFFHALTQAAAGDTRRVRSLFTDLPAFDDWLAGWQAFTPDAELMSRSNPVYIPRNHLVEEALEAATAGDLEPFHRLSEVLAQPYTERPGLERYAQPAPDSFGPYVTFCGT